VIIFARLKKKRIVPTDRDALGRAMGLQNKARLQLKRRLRGARNKKIRSKWQYTGYRSRLHFFPKKKKKT